MDEGSLMSILVSVLLIAGLFLWAGCDHDDGGSDIVHRTHSNEHKHGDVDRGDD
jgi:hypothetical protein